VRKIDAVLDLSWVHAELAPHYPTFGRPSIDPVLMIRMLIIDYVFALRSERLLCRDQTRMHAFHGQGWHDRVGIIPEIEDPRYRQIGQRLIAVERPDLLTDAQRQRWESWRRERFLTNEKVPWMTVASALEELADASQDATPAQQAQLADLERFLKGLGR